MWIEGIGTVPGQLVVLSGPSGSGKSTLLRRLLKRPDLPLSLSVSATTRAPRTGEQHGVDYYFLSTDDFLASRQAGRFLESAEYNFHHYGTPAEPVYRRLADGETVVLEIETEGAKQVRDRAPTALFIFVRPPSFQELERRLVGRGSEADASIHHRLYRARHEMAEAHWYDHLVINDDLQRAEDELAAILKTYQPGAPDRCTKN